MRIKNLIFSFLFLSFVAFVSCQSSDKNENKGLAYFNGADSLRFNLLIDSLTNYYPKDNDSIILFSDYILNSFPKQLDQINIALAHIHYSHANFYLAHMYFKNAAQIYLRDSSIKEYAEQLTNIGVTKEVSSDYVGAIDSYLNALSIFDSLKRPQESSFIYNNLGIVYQQIGDKDKALYYYKQSLKIKENLALNTTNIYNNIASVYEDLSKLDSALVYYLNAYDTQIKEDSKSTNLIIVKSNIANIYLLKKDYLRADSILAESYKEALDVQLEIIYSSVLGMQAQSLLYQGVTASAIEKANAAYNIALRDSSLEKQQKSLEVLIAAYEKIEAYNNANSLIKLFYQNKEKLSGIEQKKHINQLNSQYLVNEKEHEIRILKLNNDIQNRKLWQLWIFITALFFLLVGLVIILRLQKKNNKLQVQQMRRDIADYLSQIKELNNNRSDHKQIILDKIKQFNLTQREEDILLLISKGYKNAEIAEKLFLSINTIKTHTKNIFVKLDVRNRIEASRKAQII